MKRLVLALALFVASSQASSQDWVWNDMQGHPAPDIPARKSSSGFGGWLLVTSDSDWEEKWNTPSDSVPHFTEATTVTRGNRIFVLIFFANPLLSKSGEADVACDIEIERPNKTYSVQQHGAICFKGALQGAASNLYLALPVFGFLGEPGDPLGKWDVRVKLIDKIRNVQISLETAFTLN
jgi:hypothetical protein